MTLSDKSETRKVNAKANKHSKTERVAKTFVVLLQVSSSIIKPPTIIGMLIKKLYSAEFSSSFPQNVNAEIVLPDLDSPGRTASP